MIGADSRANSGQNICRISWIFNKNIFGREGAVANRMVLISKDFALMVKPAVITAIALAYQTKSI